MGTTIDVVDGRDLATDWLLYLRIENEANAFASELLLPRGWLSQLCEEMSVAEVHRFATAKAETSLAATAIALLDAAPAGCLYAQVKEGVVVRAKQSPGTISRNVPYGAKYSDLILQNVIETGVLQDSVGVHVWWKIDEVTHPPPKLTEYPWRELQTIIFGKMNISDSEQRKLAQRINGVVSAANSKMIGLPDRTVERLYTNFVLRLSDANLGPGMKEFRSHDLFLEYLRVRAESFMVHKDGIFIT